MTRPVDDHASSNNACRCYDNLTVYFTFAKSDMPLLIGTCWAYYRIVFLDVYDTFESE